MHRVRLKHGIKYGTLRARLFVRGWSLEKALSVPLFIEKRRHIKHWKAA